MNKERVCIKCGDDISDRSHNAKYCVSCYKKISAEKRFISKGYKSHRNKKIELKCPICAESFLKPPCHITKNNFCSKNCYSKYQKWLYEKGLGTLKPPLTIPLDTKMLKDLYYKNLTDPEIADILGTSQGTIRNRRLALNLISRHKPNQFNLKEKENLIKFGIANDLRRMDCLKLGTGGDKHEHAKWAICLILFRKGYHFLTEVKTEKGIIDIYDFTNKNIYEVESILTEKKRHRKFNQLFNDTKMNDFFIFDLRKVPNEGLKMIKYFEEKIV